MNRICKYLLSIGSAAAVLCGILTAMPVSAADDNTFTDKTLTYEKIDGGVRIISAEPGTIKLNIGKTIDGHAILEIGEKAFLGCSQLSEVTLSKGLRKIGKGAFSGCMNLQSVNIPDTVTEIGEGAFYYCGSLKEITVPESVQSIGGSAFANCFSMETVNLPDSMTSIPPYLFYYDIALEHITLPKSLTYIGQMSFVCCYALRDFTIPASVTEIDPAAVIGCSGIERYEVADGSTAFCTDERGAVFTADRKTLMLYPAGCEEAVYSVPDGTESLAPYACSGSIKLETLELPATVTEIGEGVLSDCQSLKQFTFPSNITRIPDSMFANSSIASFTVPETVTEIGAYAFFGCKDLAEITIPESVTSIEDEAYFGCTSALSVHIPDSVTHIGDYAFGYYMPENAQDNAQPSLMADFTLSCSPQSAAKQYAAANGVRFKQIGIDVQTLLFIGIALLLLVLIVVSVILIRRGKKIKAEQAAAAPPEEPDPNYESILADGDAGDPFERHFGDTSEE